MKAALHPERNQRGQHAGKEDYAPPETRHHHGHQRGADRVADGPRALHQRESLAAILRGPRFSYQGRAGSPFAAHAQAEEDAAQHQLNCSVRKSAERRGHGVAEHAEGESAHAAKAVGEPSKG